MAECSHREATLSEAAFLSGFFAYSCPCGLQTGPHGTVEEASEEWGWVAKPRDEAAIQRRCEAIKAKESRGEGLTPAEETILAYAPAELGGTAASCPSSVVFARDFLLGSA